MIRSKQIGNILVLFLKIGLVLTILSFIGSLLLTYAFDWYSAYISGLDDFIAIFNLVLWVLTIILFFVWLYKVHKDVREMDPIHLVTPGWSVASFMIPLYNLYGMWNVFWKLSTFFINSGKDAEEGGHRLRRYMPWYYVVLLGSNALQRFASNFPELVTNTLILFSVTVDLLLNLICLWMAQSIIRSLDAAWLSRTENRVSGEQTPESPQPSIPL